MIELLAPAGQRDVASNERDSIRQHVEVNRRVPELSATAGNFDALKAAVACQTVTHDFNYFREAQRLD